MNKPYIGKIPDWLEGTILRNGVGQWDLGGESVVHWFDGHALLHKFEIKNGSGTRARQNASVATSYGPSPC